MDALIKEITSRTGISDDQARTAVNTVVSYLKSKLPGPLASQIDSVLGGLNNPALAGNAEKAASGLINALNRK